VIAGFGPRGELPSPLPISLLLPLPFLLPCAPPVSPSRAPCSPSRAPRWPLLAPAACSPTRPAPLAAAPRTPSGSPVPCGPAPLWPCAPAAVRPGGPASRPRRPCPFLGAATRSRARDRSCATSNLQLIHFKFSLVDVLRRALHRAMIHFKIQFY
jgi:hypothetical protein